MSKKIEKLKTLLNELFRLDRPDLDFGIYRIMRARSEEITKYLEEGLLPQVKDAFEQYKSGDIDVIENKINLAIQGAKDAGFEPEESPTVIELRKKLADESIDLGSIENEVFDHLFNFFRRYFDKGDFLSKRVYKPGVYAIPYEGEEVKLHWANSDQYYVKTSEYLRNYSFCLQPDNDENPMRVNFELVDIDEEEHGNIKEQGDKKRRFRLTPEPFHSLENNELTFRFTHKTESSIQKKINDRVEKSILDLKDKKLTKWIEKLKTPHTRKDGLESDKTPLRSHLEGYTKRNNSDYFIHKDLGGFLHRELDFYIKNEVMHLDDIENESVPKVEQYLSKIKVIRNIATKIIQFLAQIENFQKKLWLKKKIVVETNYCITLDRVPEELFSEIAANEAQCDEWVNLFAIDEIKNNHQHGGYSQPLTIEFLKGNNKLVLDSKFFGSEFKAKLIDSFIDFDEQCDGLLIHSENFQALNLINRRYSDGIKCVYFDPPYNTDSDGFPYKDSYKSSSWMTMMNQVVTCLYDFLQEEGSLFAHCDENEFLNFGHILQSVFDKKNHVETITWNKRVPKNDKGVGNLHEYIYLFAKNQKARRSNERDFVMLKDNLEEIYKIVQKEKSKDSDLVTAQKALKKFYKDQGFDRGITLYCELDLDFEIFGKINMSWPSAKGEGPRYEVINPATGKPAPIPDRGWRWKEETFREAEQNGPTFKLPDGSIVKGKIWYSPKETIQPSSIIYLKKVERFLLRSIISQKSDGSIQLDNLGLGGLIDYPKPVKLSELIFYSTDEESGYFLDCFAGSGTAAHGLLSLNRESLGNRKYILVEMGNHFDTLLKPRIAKVVYSESWKDGKPTALQTGISQCIKYVCLESYEDTLNNLQLNRNDEKKSLFDFEGGKADGEFKEQYLLNYMLELESAGCQSLLNISDFMTPTGYKMNIKRPGSDESNVMNVDLIETFNWLIGITVKHLSKPQFITAEFLQDGEGRLCVNGELQPDEEGAWWFRSITGTLPDGRQTLVIWRNRPGGEDTEGVERDNLMLNEWFSKQKYDGAEEVFNHVYVNGSNNLDLLKKPEDNWSVRMIEDDFFNLMFE